MRSADRYFAGFAATLVESLRRASE